MWSELSIPTCKPSPKSHDEALPLFHQHKFGRAKEGLEEVLKGKSKELADRARVHLKIVEQRMTPAQEQKPPKMTNGRPATINWVDP